MILAVLSLKESVSNVANEAGMISIQTNINQDIGMSDVSLVMLRCVQNI